MKNSIRTPGVQAAATLLLMLLMPATMPPVISYAQAPPPRREQPAPSSVSLPDSPAGRQLAAWLAAFNTGKRQALQQFVAGQYETSPDKPLPVEEIVGRDLGLFRTTGGFALRKVEAATPESVTVAVQARRTGYWMSVQIYVAAQPPHKIVGFGIRNTETPAEFIPRKRLSDAQIGKNLDALITKLVEADAFSGVVLVAKNGRPVYKRTAGLASRAWNAPNRIDTRFNLASMSKMFTAVAVAQLAEQGKLSYGDTVGKLLPDYPDKTVAGRVTVHQLLTHTAGLPGARAGVDRMLALQRQGARTVGEYVTAFSGDPLVAEPGAKFDYSNYGYILLGAIIEKVSGQNYYDYVRAHIYRPAGMTDSDSYELDAEPRNLATGYMDAPGGARRSNIHFLGVRGGPAGGSYSTAEDLLRFETALRNRVLLKAGAAETLWQGKVLDPEQNSHYGYGFTVRRYNGTRIVGHSGGWFGVTNQFDIYPDLGYTFVVLSNQDIDARSMANKVREWLTQGR